MPWCNLFSTALKFNVEVKSSSYKPIVYFSLAQLFVAFGLLQLTDAYLFILVFIIVSIALLSFYYSLQSNRWAESFSEAPLLYQFEIDQQGLCSFDGQTFYQLQASSRISFLGAWLYFLPVSPSSAFSKIKPKHLFIFRDSITKQSFSRLSALLNSVNFQVQE